MLKINHSIPCILSNLLCTPAVLIRFHYIIIAVCACIVHDSCENIYHDNCHEQLLAIHFVRPCKIVCNSQCWTNSIWLIHQCVCTLYISHSMWIGLGDLILKFRDMHGCHIECLSWVRLHAVGYIYSSRVNITNTNRREKRVEDSVVLYTTL